MTEQRSRTEPASKEADRQRVVLVLGMHRSGTSVAAEIVSRLGLPAGSDADLIGATPFNPRGHFEHRSGVEFDNEMLRAAGGTWDDPPPMGKLEALDHAHIPDIEAWYGAGSGWTFKDPRLCLTLPIWMRTLSAHDVRIVHMLRDPHAVARSVTHRNRAMELPASRFRKNEMGAADVLGLWSEYNRRAALYEERFALPRLYVWYDQLVDAPEPQVQRIADFVGCEAAASRSVADCVRPELRRS
jgi:hypothetical protein